MHGQATIEAAEELRFEVSESSNASVQRDLIGLIVDMVDNVRMLSDRIDELSARVDRLRARNEVR